MRLFHPEGLPRGPFEFVPLTVISRNFERARFPPDGKFLAAFAERETPVYRPPPVFTFSRNRVIVTLSDRSVTFTSIPQLRRRRRRRDVPYFFLFFFRFT